MPAWAWIGFGLTIAALLALDLFVHRGGRASSQRAAVSWSVIWIVAGVAFAGFIAAVPGASWHEYLAAYAMEKSLSLDNMFVFLLIFEGLNVPHKNQHVVLAWGIFGALVFRGAFIAAGVSALEQWEWIRYIFGGILVLAAVHAFREDPTEQRDSRLVQWLSRHLPVTDAPHEYAFVQKRDGRWMATPLLVALVSIELSDVVFAVDSVPAALAVSRDRFVVYSSNAFAILGLRALYLALHATLTELTYLHYGLSAVLLFAGAKLMAGEVLHIDPLLSVAIIVVLIAAAAVPSLFGRQGREAEAQPEGQAHSS